MDKTIVLKAIADETRMKILTLLLRHSYCVRGLANALELTERTHISHLKVLREAGLLVGEKNADISLHMMWSVSALHELAGEIETLAAMERTTCRPAERDDTPAAESKGVRQKGPMQR